MMMPANYSAISAEEMTYVNGGALDVAGMASTLWSNAVTIVGNSFITRLVGATLGVLFGGSYTAGAVTNKLGAAVGNAYNVVGGGANGVLNAGLQIIGAGAAAYQLATVNVDPAADAVLTIEKK